MPASMRYDVVVPAPPPRLEMPSTARFDPARGARVVSRTPLVYRRGADAAFDRPAHVRAGSALVTLATGHLAVIQDDACFLAILSPDGRDVLDVAFPPTEPLDPRSGVTPRQFDDTRGNKKRKLDLEAVFVTPDGTLVALGSGSSPLRERVVLVEEPSSDAPRITILPAPSLYRCLREERAFAGAELNVEGAVVVGEDLVLFQRGNGAPSRDFAAIDATARIALRPLLAHLLEGGELPPLRDVRAWDLGQIDGHRLTFTDASVAPRSSAIAFLACAEDSPDVTRDGPVSAVVLGYLDEQSGVAWMGAILDERGAPLLDKAEGLAFDPTDAGRAFVVTDRDDPDAPSELLVLALGERWLSTSRSGDGPRP